MIRRSARSGALGTRARTLLAALTVAAAAGCAEAAEEPADGSATLTGVIPAGTDIWIADLHWEQTGPPAIDTPTNVTRREGYDNQPFFVPDGSGFWYTAIDEQIGQADIWRYELGTGMVTRVTASAPESEYSANPLPDGSGVSVIRVEADSTQRLWRFDHDGSNGAVLFEELAPVGYHAWADDRTVVMFVLGDPATLRRGDVMSGAVDTIAEDVGRSIHRIPGTNDISYAQRHEDGSSTIMRLRPGSSDPEPIIDGVEGSQDHAWAPDGTLFMARESIVYAFTAGVSDGWTPVGDFSSLFIQITRLAVSPDGSQIALVGEVVL